MILSFVSMFPLLLDFFKDENPMYDFMILCFQSIQELFLYVGLNDRELSLS